MRKNAAHLRCVLPCLAGAILALALGVGLGGHFVNAPGANVAGRPALTAPAKGLCGPAHLLCPLYSLTAAFFSSVFR